MRTTLTLLLGAGATIASAQLVNGSFEDGLNGWIFLPTWSSAPAMVTSDYPVPIDGGSSLMIPTTSDNTAQEQNRAIQPLPDVQEGDALLFSGWMRNTYDGSPTASMRLGYCDSTGIQSFFGPILSSGVIDQDWTWFEANTTVPTAGSSGVSVCVCLNGGTVYGGGSGAIAGPYFDGLSVQLDPSTNVDARQGSQSYQIRPNPAADKLWIDLPETAISITAIDASGRTHDLKNFTHRDRTVEVDVNTLPTGICLLRITTASGTHAVRFVKA